MAFYNNVLAGAAGAGGAADFQISKSLRFSSGDSSYLSRTPASAGNRKTFTFSCWLKKSGINSSNRYQLLSSYASGSVYFTLEFETEKLKVFDGSAISGGLATDGVFRDPSAWYHILCAVDTTDGTAANRVKLYVNGVQQTLTGTQPSQNSDLGINTTTSMSVGALNTGSILHILDGYLADVNFIDGQALAPTEFGEFDSNNVWVATAYGGNYDTPVNQGATWSNLVSTSDTLRTGSGAFAYGALSTIFDGSLSTGVGTTAGNLTLSFSSGISTSNSTVEVYVYHTYSATITAGGNTYTTNTGGGGTSEWVKVTGVSGTITQISVDGGGSVGTCGGIKIDGKLLVDTGLTVNNNGFNLNFSDNSSNAALGTDSSGNSNTWTVNNIIGVGGDVIYSSGLSIPEGGGFHANGPASEAFDGDLTQAALGANTSTSVRWTVNSSWSLSGAVEIYVSGAAMTVTFNDGRTSVSATANAWTQVSSSVDFTWINIYQGSGLRGNLAAVRVGGTVLTQSSELNDCLIDTPTNYTAASGNNGGNYCTLNPLESALTGINNGNLNSGSSGAASWKICTSTMAVSSGKYYWEGFTTVTATSSAGWQFGFCQVGPSSLTTPYGTGKWSYQHGTVYSQSSSGSAVGTSAVANDLLAYALDMDAGTCKLYVNNSLVHTFTGISGTITPFVGSYSSPTVTVNFGQRPFAYTPPTGHLSLCTTNLPDPTIADGSTAFATKLYTGNGGTQTISGLNFSPDFTWIKNRNSTDPHIITDIVRGAGKLLQAQATTAETDNSDTATAFSAFTSDGFTVGYNANWSTNTNSSPFVSWNWDAGTVANPVGDIWSPGATKYIGIKFATASGGTVVYGQTSGSDTVEVWTSSDNSSWTQQGGTLTLSAGHTLTTTDQYVYIRNASDATFSNWYAAASNGADGHYSSVTYPSGASWSGPAYTDHDFRDGGGTLIALGGLNSSIYNQSHAITSNITDNLPASGNPLANWFNGQRANKLEPSGSGSLDFSSVSALQNFSGTLQFAVSAYSGSTSMKFVINASTDNLTFTTEALPSSSGGFPSQLLTIPVTSLSTLDFTSVGGQSTQFWGMYLDGKLLVDSTATPDTLPSIATTVRANASAGFSIVSYKGNGVAGDQDIAHGLNAVPALVIIKDRTSGQSYPQWTIKHKDLTTNKNILFTNAAEITAIGAGGWYEGGIRDLTSSNTFGLGNGANSVNTNVNYSGTDYIAYCFAPVEGYSSFGSFNPNGTTDNSFVYTGFLPKFLLLKYSSHAGDWMLLDTSRRPNGPAGGTLVANVSNAEDGYYSSSQANIDFLSNGFKIRVTGSPFGDSGRTVIYAAFAEHPFKTARAR